MADQRRKAEGRRGAMSHRSSLYRQLPALVALLVIGAIYALVAQQWPLGLPGLIPGLIMLLAVLLVIAALGGHPRLRHALGLASLAVVTVAETVGAGLLIINLVTASQRMNEMPQAFALLLLRDSALIWLVNILTFSFWYWEIDDGGPLQRHMDGYRSQDFVFPQRSVDTEAARAWAPHYVDYLFLAFTMSTAFSPTDTLVLSVRAKILVMLQALISLTVLAIIAARAINTL